MSVQDAGSYRKNLDWMMIGIVNVTIAVWISVKYRLGQTDEKVALISAGVCVVFLNLAVLWAVRRRRGNSGEPLPKSLVLGGAILGIIAFASTAVCVLATSHHSNYLDLAMSNRPLSSIDPEQTRLVVELLRGRAANSRENDKLLAEARRSPLNPALYSADSFAGAAVMKSTVERLTYFIEADFQYSEKQQALMQDFRQKMAQSDPAYLRSWDATRQEQETAEASAEKLEHEWLKSVQSLYAYAEDHTREISLKDGKLHFSAPAVQTTFAQQMTDSTALHDKWLILEQGLAKAKQKSEEKLIMP
jgi:hypothetical protein